MRRTIQSFLLTLIGLGFLSSNSSAQTPVAKTNPAPQPKATAPQQPNVVPNAAAATVNGQSIPESMVQRALKRVPPNEQAKARAEILDFLIDNMLIEQYLVQQKIVIEPKEVDARLGEIQAEMQKHKQDFSKMLQDFSLSEAELKSQIMADLRWEKFAMTRATEPTLKDMFDKNLDMFDGTMVRARHILLAPANDSNKAALQSIRKEILSAGDAALAKLPANTDPLSREQARTKALEDAFIQAAEKHSNCPSKRQGGDISWFPRIGSMVEPFAKVAFAMKPYEVSDIVVTPQFGVHLIMVIGRKPGQPVTFEKLKEEVRDVYCAQMRESMCSQLRQASKIVVTPVK